MMLVYVIDVWMDVGVLCFWRIDVLPDVLTSYCDSFFLSVLFCGSFFLPWFLCEVGFYLYSADVYASDVLFEMYQCSCALFLSSCVKMKEVMIFFLGNERRYDCIHLVCLYDLKLF